MNIILLTQEDPFYLPETTKEFIEKVKGSNKHSLILAIISDASPFGKKGGFITKVKKTYDIFGINFFVHYSFKYFYRKIILRKSVSKEIIKQGVPLLRLKNSINNDKNVQLVKSYNPDVIIIIAGNQIIKKNILEIPKYGVINAHSSLLPEYKGLMPTFWVLKNNESKTGVTVYKLTEGIDDGPIILSESIKIHPHTTQASLITSCKRLANKLLLKSLDLLENQDNFKPNVGGSYYKFPSAKDVKEFYKIEKKFF